MYVLVGPHDPNPGGLGKSPRTVICGAQRTWLIAPRNGRTPTFGRDRKLVTQWGKAELYLYEGTGCTS